MDIDGASLVAMLIVSCVGFVVFRYGRSQERFPHVAIGLLLMVFPYVVSDPLLMGLIAAALLGLLWIATRMGL